MKFVERSYEERRIIAIVEPASSEPRAEGMWDKMRHRVNQVGPTKMVAAAIGTLVVGPAKAATAAAGAAIHALWSNGDGDGRLPGDMVAVPLDEAKETLRFPPGHPIVRHVYAAHPLVRTRYIPVASFHRSLLEEKANELMFILASLGATRVRVCHKMGYRMNGGGSVEVNMAHAFGGDSSDDGSERPGGMKSPNGGKQKAKNQGSSNDAYGFDASGRHERRAEVMFEEEYRPSGQPRLPDGLHWYAHEPSWRAVAERRMKFNTAKFQATLNYTESYGIDAKLKVAVEGAGLKLGGEFTEFAATSWQFEGEFA